MFVKFSRLSRPFSNFWIARYHFSGISATGLLSDATDNPGLFVPGAPVDEDWAAWLPEFNFVESIWPSRGAWVFLEFDLCWKSVILKVWQMAIYLHSGLHKLMWCNHFQKCLLTWSKSALSVPFSWRSWWVRGSFCLGTWPIAFVMRSRDPVGCSLACFNVLPWSDSAVLKYCWSLWAESDMFAICLVYIQYFYGCPPTFFSWSGGWLRDTCMCPQTAMIQEAQLHHSINHISAILLQPRLLNPQDIQDCRFLSFTPP